MRLKGGPALATNNSLGNLGVLTPIADALLIPACSSMPTTRGRFESTPQLELVVAHPSDPAGTRLRVTNLENERAVD